LPDIPAKIKPVAAFQPGSAKQRMNFQRKIAGQILQAHLEIERKIKIIPFTI
jgi:hypothetical protein